MPTENRICVVGLGYIGLPTACIFAESGFDVLGVDINPGVVEAILQGKSHLQDEPDLQRVLSQVVKNGKLKVALQPAPADLFLICVPTPFRENHQADLTYVEAAVQSVLPHLRQGTAIALESTSPPGTTEKVIGRAVQALNLKIGKDVFIAYCPERVLPGQILKELKNNPRIVGGMTSFCAQHISEYYRKIVQAPVLETKATVAETVKLVENSFRDVNIAFANEISMLCSKIGINHREVIGFANEHPRVKILAPGPGVGGHCIAVDPWFLVEAAPELTPLIRTAREVNLKKTRFVIDQIKNHVSERFKKSGIFQKIYLFGMAYKPNVADFRESPAIAIYQNLAVELGKMAAIFVVDPYLSHSNLEGISVVKPSDVPTSSHLEVLKIRLVPHRQFEELSFDLDFSS